ncbi:hypothetical protein CYMTET_5582 [Cymbomonas tetramitiformis]|uniref:Uncharacterized protein n=1 Tax=Cymbomonas tetramitiformis TaxID=36881 RepID=A0AAE0H0R5_9CHLO|nr:hypothetical protein CYMTET_5582 [Cymbomonas tetramitiformis]
MALQAQQDPAPDSATDVAIMGFRAADPPAEDELLATESSAAATAVDTSPSTAAFNAMELDDDDTDWPAFRTVPWVPSINR